MSFCRKIRARRDFMPLFRSLLQKLHKKKKIKMFCVIYRLAAQQSQDYNIWFKFIPILIITSLTIIIILVFFPHPSHDFPPHS